MRRRPFLLTMLAALAMLSACNGKPAPTAPTRVAASPDAASSPGDGVIQGLVVAPAGFVASVIPVGGGNVVPVGGGNVITAGAGNLLGLSTGFARRVLDLSESPLANTQVFLADAAGEPYPAIAPVTTDAEGKFSFPKVPSNYTYMVVAQAHDDTRQKDVTLQTLVRSSNLGATTSIDASTSLVTLAVTQGQSDLGSFNAAAFRTATQDVGKKLDASQLPDLSDRSAMLTEVDQLSTQISELQQSLDAVRQQLQQVDAELATIKKELSSPRPSPTPSATPTAAPSPTDTGGNGMGPGGACAPVTHQFKLAHTYPAYPISVDFMDPRGNLISEVVFNSSFSTPSTGIPEGCPMSVVLLGQGNTVINRYDNWSTPVGSPTLLTLPL